MAARKRITRPTLPRNAPIRTWSTLFGPVASEPASGTPAGPMGAVQRGVEFAYRVSEEYLRQGQAMARLISQPTNGAGGARNGAALDLPQLTERMLRYSTELSTMWMEAMQMMSGGAARAPAPTPTPGPARLAIEIESKLSTRATLDLRQPARGAVSVGALQLEGGGAQIRGVTVEPAAGDRPATIVIRVPPRQRAGTYVGEVVDTVTMSPIGAVTVRVGS
jgi:hypothetical protein